MRICLIIAMSLALTGTARAQEAADYAAAFAGTWLVFDERHAGAVPCRITLHSGGDPLAATSDACTSALVGVDSWRIEAGQLQLLATGQPLAHLGGTTTRISGWDADGAPLVLDREAGTLPVDPLAFARAAKGCWFLGYTGACADPVQTSPPAAEGARICTLVALRLRSDPRPDAALIGVLPAESCIATDVCLTTATGPWCFARFETGEGWMPQYALRLEKWPVLTFTAAD